MVSHEIKGEPFTDGEYMKTCIISAFEHPFSNV